MRDERGDACRTKSEPPRVGPKGRRQLGGVRWVRGRGRRWGGRGDGSRIRWIAMLKIIAGEFRSRKLLTPDDGSVSRPYGARVKESIFNLLRGWFEGATVIDLFAGVGTMGLEAVSRGAARVFMVERDRHIA